MSTKTKKEVPQKAAWYENKWIRAAIPALLLHCSIGTVYCWSIFKQDIANYIGKSAGQVEWGFSIAIFFLGMSAAFGGHIVEKDIKKSSLIAAFCFSLGMLGTGISIWQKSLIGIYLCYGVLMGIGLGIGYLTPVKTLMLWFSKNKGLGTGLAVAGFGLAKMIASPVMTYFKDTLFADSTDPAANSGVYKMFFALAAIYFVMMILGHLLIRKPAGWVEDHGKSDFKPGKVLKNPVFIGIWLMFYLNITCGLAIISQEKDILHELLNSNGELALSAGAIAIILSIDAMFNAGGRLGFATISDRLKDRNTIYKIIFVMSMLILLAVILTNAIDKSIIPLVLALFFLINSGYGGGFSSVPPLLSDRFGMKTISTVHGLTLSAWAFAGLSGNQLASFIVHKLGKSYSAVLYVMIVLYFVAFLSSRFLVKPGKFGED